MNDIDGLLDPILATFRGKLKTTLEAHAVVAYLRGSAEMTQWGLTKGGKPIYFEGPPIQQAMSYAERHCAMLVTGIDRETKTLLAQVISDGIKNKRGIDGLARDIRREFRDMRKTRSQVIARTETSDALEQAFMDRAKDLGIDGKEVIWPGGDCEICAANEVEGIVPLNHVFSSGHLRPPFHPNCRCALAPAMLPK